jgi:hypothetical protein
MSDTHRREFLKTTLGATAGTLAGGVLLSGCGQQQKKADLKGKEKEFDDRVTEFCAKEPLGEGGGYYHYVGIGCPGAWPCTYSSPTPLSWPCNCGDAGCVTFGSELRKRDWEQRQSTTHPIFYKLESPPADKVTYIQSGADFKLAEAIANRAEVVSKEVCYLKVQGEAEPRKVKLFRIKARFNVKPMEEATVETGLGFEIDPKEDIELHKPQKYDITRKAECVCELKQHPSKSEFVIFLKKA